MKSVKFVDLQATWMFRAYSSVWMKILFIVLIGNGPSAVNGSVVMSGEVESLIPKFTHVCNKNVFTFYSVHAIVGHIFSVAHKLLTHVKQECLFASCLLEYPIYTNSIWELCIHLAVPYLLGVCAHGHVKRCVQIHNVQFIPILMPQYCRLCAHCG